jgi:hypothetical protein
VEYAKARLWGTSNGLYEHILNAPNQQTAVRKILDLADITHVLVMDFDERLMIVLVAGKYLAVRLCSFVGLLLICHLPPISYFYNCLLLHIAF